jgi:O-acetyl-ADP-ribose deacetylase
LLGGRGEAELLASCYRESLRLAREHGLHNVAFPAISCGVYGYPLLKAVAIAVREVLASLHADASSRIVFCCFGAEAADAYRRELGGFESSGVGRWTPCVGHGNAL